MGIKFLFWQHCHCELKKIGLGSQAVRVDLVLETQKCQRICAPVDFCPICHGVLLLSYDSHFCISLMLDGPFLMQDDRINRRPFRKEKDDKVHDSIIEERIRDYRRSSLCPLLCISHIMVCQFFVVFMSVGFT